MKRLGSFIKNLNLDEGAAGNILKRVGNILLFEHTHIKEISDAFSESQVRSKSWIVEECVNHQLNLKTIFLCGGWFATLFLDRRLKFDKVRSFDIDPKYEQIAEELHHELVNNLWKFKAVTADMFKIDFGTHTFQVNRKDGTRCTLTESPDTIINTSCEHIHNFKDFYKLIPDNKLLILQSNDGFEIPGHINCSIDLKTFSELTPMSTVIYSGQRTMPHFTRFMRIGYK